MNYLCSNPWTTLFVWGNGNVSHCCYSNIGSLGNIKNQSLTEIWNSKKLHYVRQKLLDNDYIKAGCEYYCRSFRWNEFYGRCSPAPLIPEGLGRIESFNHNQSALRPSILGIGIDWVCNLNCRHCLSSGKTQGLSKEYFNKIFDHIKNAKIFRFMGGEFAINKKCLGMIKEIAGHAKQPTIFLSTNGQTSLVNIMPYIKDLRSFHLKFSLENIGEDYEVIRRGAKWSVFEDNLFNANKICEIKRKNGYDWRLYLNCCVMKLNFMNVPEIIKYAIKTNIPLVLNTLNGMRHIDENVFMYSNSHLKISDNQIKSVENSCRELFNANNNYCFKEQLQLHFSYIIRSLNNFKLNIPKKMLKILSKVVKKHNADVLLYALYKIVRNKKAFFIYLLRKIIEKLKR